MRNSDNKTPSIANWILSRLVRESQLEEFFGDLQEMYEERLFLKGKFHAQLMYWIEVVHLMIGFSSVHLFKIKSNNITMLNSMFKIAWRNAIRQKQYTVLNLLGLTIGIATCMVIGLYVYDEMTYDRFHTNGDRIYRVNQPNIWGDWTEQISTTGPNVAVALREDAPEFEQVTRLLGLGSQTVTTGSNEEHKNTFKETRFYAVEENFFDVFSFELVAGNPNTVFKEPMYMVMTEETAHRYFGQDINPEDAIGRTVELKDYDGSWKTYTVQGILADVSNKSHLQFDILVSLKSQSEMMRMNGWKWIWNAFSTYGLVKEGTDIPALIDKIQEIPPKWAPPTAERIFNQTYEEYTGNNPWRLDLQSLSEIYRSGTPTNFFGPTGNPQFVQIFGAIGFLVLLLSAINFMNLSTARSTNRSKEVGIRKVLGSERKTLLKQFILESVLFVLASTVLAFAIVQFSLEAFNTLADKSIELIPHLSNPIFYAVIIAFIILLGVVAGSYPAFYLSSFQPIETLKGKLSVGFKGKGIRNGLVVFQFTISIALIVCAFFVQKQLAYTSSFDVGFAKNNVLQIHNIEQMGFETDYLDLLGLTFLAGRNFDPSRPTDKYSVILNEEAATMLYAQDQAIGKVLALASGHEDEFEIIGVVKNFNFNSIKEKIAPLVILHHQNDKVWDYGGGLSYYSMSLNSETIRNAKDLQFLLGEVENIMTEVDPTIPFEFSFMDEEFEETFRSEQRMGIILNVFTGMALIIACLGLFGLAAFSAEQRIKELGIRKVLGARISDLVITFSSEFTKLILISILLATPLAYFLVDGWLNDFAYRTPIDVWVFALATFGALIIAMATTSYQSLKAAHRNPVDILKYE